MRFLDANVFLYAIVAEDGTGSAARRWLDRLNAAAPDCTSILALDEVLWSLRKRIGRKQALALVRKLTANPGLKVVGVEPADWLSALDLMERLPGLKPRDALHAATAFSSGCTAIVSTDPDFDGIPGLRRLQP